jgi:hypothetical protein
MRDTYRITVSNLRPMLKERDWYLIHDGAEACDPGHYHIEVEYTQDSKVKVGETHFRVNDLDTVKVLGSYQVVF